MRTFDHISADSLDGYYFKGILVTTFKYLAELPVADLLLEHILINDLRHPCES